MRVNVSIPDELVAAYRASAPDGNLSALVQSAMRGVLKCSHQYLTCVRCAAKVERDELVEDQMSRGYRDAWWRLTELVAKGGTAEGAARVLKDVALRWGVRLAAELPLPRPSRAERAWARQEAERETAEKVRELPTEAGSRRRHPTARSDRTGATRATPPAKEDQTA